MFVINKRIATAILAASVSFISVNTAMAETIQSALAKAYNNNSSLNSARATLRVRDEDVAIATSGYRPTISGTVTGSYESRNGSSRGSSRESSASVGVNIRQPLFDGFRTKNNVKSAESSVYAAREGLRDIEQNTLFQAVSAYLDVIRDRKIAALRKKNVSFLVEQLRSEKARFEVGEGTRTDVAQADASRAAAIAQLSAAEAQAKSSAAIYREIVGVNPGNLAPVAIPLKILPKSMESALASAAEEHPVINARKHIVDSSLFNVKVAEGSLLPTLALEAGVSRTGDRTVNSFGDNAQKTDRALVDVRLNVPIYQGGRVAAQVRKSKESLGEARINVDVAYDDVRRSVTTAWTEFEALKASVIANKQVVAAAQLALNGVIEERKVGQRTTLDVLNAQGGVVAAQLSLVSSEHDVVQISYAILQSIGRLTASHLGLNVKIQKPEEHYEAVKDKWFGLRTPDQR